MNDFDLVNSSMGLLGNTMNYALAAKTSKADRDLTREMWDKQVEYNTNMWNLANEYNAPEQQVQRMIDAGLSPQLLYGNGTASTGNASGPASPAKPTQIPTNKPMVDFTPMMNLAIQNKLADSQIKLQQAQSVEALSKASGNEIANEIQRAFGMQTAQGQLNSILQDVKTKQSFNAFAYEMYDAETRSKVLDYQIKQLNEGKLQKELEWLPLNLKNNYLKDIATIKNINSSTGVNYAQISNLKAQEAVYGANVAALTEQANLTRSQAEFISKNYNLAVFNGQTDRLKTIVDFAKGLLPSGETGNVFKILQGSRMLEDMKTLFNFDNSPEYIIPKRNHKISDPANLTLPSYDYRDYW